MLQSEEMRVAQRKKRDGTCKGTKKKRERLACVNEWV